MREWLWGSGADFFFFFFQLKENLSGEMGLQIVRFLVLYLLCSYL